jgi:hypothetical protein
MPRRLLEPYKPARCLSSLPSRAARGHFRSSQRTALRKRRRPKTAILTPTGVLGFHSAHGRVIRSTWSKSRPGPATGLIRRASDFFSGVARDRLPFTVSTLGCERDRPAARNVYQLTVIAGHVWPSGGLAQPRDHSPKTNESHGRAPFAHEHIAARLLLALQSTKSTELGAGERANRGHAVLDARDVQPSMGKINLLPSQGAQLGCPTAHVGRPAG